MFIPQVKVNSPALSGVNSIGVVANAGSGDCTIGSTRRTWRTAKRHGPRADQQLSITNPEADARQRGSAQKEFEPVLQPDALVVEHLRGLRRGARQYEELALFDAPNLFRSKPLLPVMWDLDRQLVRSHERRADLQQMAVELRVCAQSQ